MLLPATAGWVSLPVVVGAARHSSLRAPGAVPRHSWLGSAGGGGVRFPATPGWGLLAAVVRGVWCVVCGVWCAGWCVGGVVAGVWC